MKKYILLGCAVFVISLVAFAPAGIIDRAVEQNPNLEMTNVRGTLWSGQGDISARLRSADVLKMRSTWQFEPLSLFSLTPSFQWSLSNANLQLEGSAGSSLSRQVASVQGRSNAIPLNTWLATYHIVVQGDFVISPTSLLIAERMLTDIKGQIDWSGGMVRYTLSGVLHETELPPLRAYLERDEQNQPAATIFEQNGSTPLIIASLGKNGFAKIGMTKLFTKLLRTPWPGSDPDHAVVLEVEEQVL